MYITPNKIAEFCINHPMLCKKNKELVCKQTLLASGYKTQKKYDGHYCSIYKQIISIVGHKPTHNYLKFDDNVIFCNPKICTDMFMDFLKYNNFVVINNLKSTPIVKGNSKTTVKMNITDTIKINRN